VGLADRIVMGTLRSPLHALLGRRLLIVRYAGRRTGRTVTLPTQYALDGERVIVAAGHPTSKAWWRNFAEPAPAELLVDGVGRSCELGVVTGRDREQAIAAYLRRFPRLRGRLDDAVWLIGRPA
jgi:hypothetical protein